MICPTCGLEFGKHANTEAVFECGEKAAEATIAHYEATGEFVIPPVIAEITQAIFKTKLSDWMPRRSRIEDMTVDDIVDDFHA